MYRHESLRSQTVQIANCTVTLDADGVYHGDLTPEGETLIKLIPGWYKVGAGDAIVWEAKYARIHQEIRSLSDAVEVAGKHFKRTQDARDEALGRLAALEAERERVTKVKAPEFEEALAAVGLGSKTDIEEELDGPDDKKADKAASKGKGKGKTKDEGGTTAKGGAVGAADTKNT